MIMNLLFFYIKPWPSGHFISVSVDLLDWLLTEERKAMIYYKLFYLILQMLIGEIIFNSILVSNFVYELNFRKLMGSLKIIKSEWRFIYLKNLKTTVWFDKNIFGSSVTQSCSTLWTYLDCSTPGLPVHHQLLELTQTYVHRVGDAIQSSHPLSSPSPPAFHLSQHQGLFQGVCSSHQVAKVLEFQLQHQSFQWTFRTDFL